MLGPLLGYALLSVVCLGGPDLARSMHAEGAEINSPLGLRFIWD